MQTFRSETAANYVRFTRAWSRDLSSRIEKIGDGDTIGTASYQRIASIQAWRGMLTEVPKDPQALQFLVEAQNDLLASHVMASFGAWRPSLAALRSFIDNTLHFAYYVDHPIELQRWSAGKHRLTFHELQTYFEAHPMLQGRNLAQKASTALKAEYSKLSEAVHASAVPYRMTRDGHIPTLWDDKTGSRPKWADREKRTIEAANLLLIYLYAPLISGTRKAGERKSISSAVSKARHRQIKKDLGVTLLA